MKLIHECKRISTNDRKIIREHSCLFVDKWSVGTGCYVMFASTAWAVAPMSAGVGIM